MLILTAAIAVAVWCMKVLWFDRPTYTIYVRLPNTIHVDVPCEVQKYGVTIGTITSAEATDSGELRLTAAMDQAIHLRRSDAFVYISPGSHDPPYLDVRSGILFGSDKPAIRHSDVVQGFVEEPLRH